MKKRRFDIIKELVNADNIETLAEFLKREFDAAPCEISASEYCPECSKCIKACLNDEIDIPEVVSSADEIVGSPIRENHVDDETTPNPVERVEKSDTLTISDTDSIIDVFRNLVLWKVRTENVLYDPAYERVFNNKRLKLLAQLLMAYAVSEVEE